MLKYKMVLKILFTCVNSGTVKTVRLHTKTSTEKKALTCNCHFRDLLVFDLTY